MLPTSEIQRWLLRAENMARQFQRNSSAVEGRNGCLSQRVHNGRGLSQNRLTALTVIHNYDIKRLSRKRRDRLTFNPLKLLDVPF
ncbi:MAG: DUF6399 domain-containing protein [Methylovulum sp.]|jgi:hypothetical protein|nr:DUF6399 domain-containing protein [Methylovulum sp.]MCF7997951.1 DUF6399 domain-containing protein [Methylovulum sp.]